MKRVHGMLAALLLLGACDRPEPVAEAPPSQHSDQFVVQRAAAPDYKIVSAVLTSRDVGDARARIGGTLSRLLVREGDQVRRGQVVAIISDQRLARGRGKHILVCRRGPQDSEAIVPGSTHRRRCAQIARQRCDM